MSKVTIACDKCAQELEIPDEYIGQSVVCPGCDAEFIVPEPPSESPKASASSAKKSSQKPKAKAMPQVSKTAVVDPIPADGKKANSDEITCATCKLFDWLLGILAKTLNPSWLEKNVRHFIKLGLYGIYVATGGSLIVSLLLASKSSKFSIFLYGLGVALLLLVLQYVAVRFLLAGKKLIASTPSVLASGAFLDCIALLNMIVGIGALIAGIVMAFSEYSPDGVFWIGFGVFAWCELIASICLHPESVNVTIKDGGTAGDEVLGILSFFMKAALKLVPMAFGIGIASGIIIGADSLFECFGESTFMAIAKVSMAATVLISSAAIPLTMYVLFLVYHLSIDLMRAVLSLGDRKNDLV